ncbi:MAG: hypothetical protein IJH60_04545 [Eubacterium sp.]|nr:hypothetical protein [Eubacterium sp.]
MRVVAKGKGLDSFFEGLSINESKEIRDLHCLLVKSPLPPADLGDSRCRSSWIMVDEEGFIHEENSQLYFDEKMIVLSGDEYADMAETGIAFYDEAGDGLYPLRAGAIPNLLRLIGHSTDLKEEDPFALVLIIAGHMKELYHARMMFYRKQGRVRPVFSVTSRQYRIHDSCAFVSDLIREIERHGSFTIPRWEINEERTEIEILLDEKEPVLDGRGFLLTLSDVAGTATSLISFYKYRNVYIYLKKNRLEHKGRKPVIDSMMAGMWQEYRCFRQYYELLPCILMTDYNRYLWPFEPVIGKKKLEELKKDLLPAYDNARDFYLDLLPKTEGMFTRNSPKWDWILRKEYYSLLKKLCLPESVPNVEKTEKQMGFSMDDKGQMQIIM